MKFLIIEDETGYSSPLTRALGELGHEYHLLEGRESWGEVDSLVREFSPDVILLDYDLGGTWTGWDFWDLLPAVRSRTFSSSSVRRDYGRQLPYWFEKGPAWEKSHKVEKFIRYLEGGEE